MKNSLLFLLLALFTGSSLMAMQQSEAAFSQAQDDEKMREAREAARKGLDLYKMLDLREGATAQEIHVAGRKKLARLHPDRGGNAQEFQRINNAYSILKDLQARAMYDKTRKKFSRSVWQERRHKFMNAARNYKQSIIVATASAATTALALSYQAVNCGDVAKAICNGEFVRMALLQGCANYIPSRLDCLLNGW